MSSKLFHDFKVAVAEALNAANRGELTKEHMQSVHDQVDRLQYQMERLERDASESGERLKVPFKQRPVTFKRDENADRVGVFVYGRRVGNARDQGSLILFESGGTSRSFTTKRKLFDWVRDHYAKPLEQANGSSQR